jgi:hypothetical protein
MLERLIVIYFRGTRKSFHKTHLFPQHTQSQAAQQQCEAAG